MLRWVHFVRMRSYPDASYRDVTAPNADTLYTTTWIDVSKEPWILSLPDMKDRYFLFPMLDGWTNVFQVPGKRTTGTKAQTYAITGPGWSGELPPGVTEYKAPTGLVWILGRIYCTGTPEDYKAVHALRQGFGRAAVRLRQALHPGARHGQPGHRHEDRRARAGQCARCGSVLQAFAELLKTNPAAADDAQMVAKLAKMDRSRAGFRRDQARPSRSQGPGRAPKPAQEVIMDWMKAGIVAGDLNWNTVAVHDEEGLYGTQYVQRALVTAIGLGANRPEDAVYPTSTGPDIAAKYNGEKNTSCASKKANCRL